MAQKKEAKRALDNKLKGVMDFYVSTYFEHYSQQIKDEVAKHNMHVETDMMDRHIDDRIQEVSTELTTKFHDVCMLILDTVMSGREDLVREFEVLFLDLVKRTLVKEMQDKKRPVAPIIIISDQGVNAKEN
jgi:hypothetical protein